jgi:hypothetical protein
MVTFNVVCTYVGTRGLVQEYLVFKTWPLRDDCEMPKMSKKIIRMQSLDQPDFAISISLKMSSRNLVMNG